MGTRFLHCNTVASCRCSNTSKMQSTSKHQMDTTSDMQLFGLLGLLVEEIHTTQPLCTSAGASALATHIVSNHAGDQGDVSDLWTASCLQIQHFFRLPEEEKPQISQRWMVHDSFFHCSLTYPLIPTQAFRLEHLRVLCSAGAGGWPHRRAESLISTFPMFVFSVDSLVFMYLLGAKKYVEFLCKQQNGEMSLLFIDGMAFCSNLKNMEIMELPDSFLDLEVESGVDQKSWKK